MKTIITLAATLFLSTVFAQTTGNGPGNNTIPDSLTNVCAPILELGEDITKASICADVHMDDISKTATLNRIFVTVTYANQGFPFDLENTVIMKKKSLSSAPAKTVCSLFGMKYVSGSAETSSLSWMNHGYDFKTLRSEESGFFPFHTIDQLKCK